MKKLLTLLALAALLLVGCADINDPNGAQVPDTTTATTITVATTTAETTTAPVTTDERDVILHPEDYSDVKLEAKRMIWALIKDKVSPMLTINNLTILNVVKYEDAYILRYEGCPGPAIAHLNVYEMILTYEFRASAEFGPLKVFADGEFFTLQQALDSGFYTEDDIRNIWEIYKEAFPEYYAEDAGTFFPLLK